METRITAVISRHFGLDPAEITPATTFEDLDMDSLALAETVVVLEEELGFEFPDIEGAFSPKATLAQAAEALALLVPTAPAGS
ncbi:acyl carrier protein [Streptomyces sp. NBC_01387]|uniref:acyl carrier protein n=1 Tax=unclassified Streptomyces TaxID=2593676 RepID=UPI0020244197|nr:MULTISPECIES: acyl carrier protein [unclassified Streptomyces]MCX4553711.1 acyl carrier protein [Streptomyces sp. NBC_01500]WSC18636.1 acyl carrier protein [Streptomyces sp. NBC_01766]WSV52670.1 acyl carrier protein [Streptomyces sp. NBC_01014]